MSKFYVQSGEIQEVFHVEDYKDALYLTMKKYVENKKNKKYKKSLKIGDNFFISQKGFIPHILDYTCLLFAGGKTATKLYDEANDRHAEKCLKFDKLEWDFIPLKEEDFFLEQRCGCEIFDKKEGTNMVELLDRIIEKEKTEEE